MFNYRVDYVDKFSIKGNNYSTINYLLSKQAIKMKIYLALIDCLDTTIIVDLPIIVVALVLF